MAYDNHFMKRTFLNPQSITGILKDSVGEQPRDFKLGNQALPSPRSGKSHLMLIK
jgi:hypothetical protein